MRISTMEIASFVITMSERIWRPRRRYRVLRTWVVVGLSPKQKPHTRTMGMQL